MAIRKTEAFVLKTQPFRSSSLIVTVFSRSFGKLRGIAKGVRREREVRGAVFELFTHLEILFYEKLRSDLHLISEAFILNSYDTLRTRLDAIAYASYYSEMVDYLCEVHDPHEGVFDLLQNAFKFLPSVQPERISRLFEIKLMKEIGWIPYLDACLSCQNPVIEQGSFSIAQGGVFCADCQSKAPESKSLSPETLAVLRFYTDHTFEECLKYRLLPETQKKLNNLMAQFMGYRIGFQFKSSQFLHKIAPILTSPA